MNKLVIKDIDNTIYKLIDDKGFEYQLNLEFIGLDRELKINDIIEISVDLLNPNSNSYSSFYTFGLFNNPTGRNNVSINDNDVIKIIINNEEIYLKRLYG